MKTNLYLLSNGQTIKMNEYKYQEEADLQQLIADNPQLLSIYDSDLQEQILLISRELQIIKNEDNHAAYSLDHLFVNQDGLPILVEVKRSSDTRIRREVIAQMLDYASRAAAWNIEHLRQKFQANNTADVLQTYDTDEFWQQVAINLRTEHMRLIFAADEIPNTLQIIIEFLNRNLKNIEVYGVEVQQYKTAETTMLSSNIIGGNTLRATVSEASGIEWTADKFAQQILTMTQTSQNELIEIVEAVRIFSEQLGCTCTFGHGSKFATFIAKIGNIHFYKISNWIYRNNVYRCSIEFPISDLAKMLNSKWSAPELRTLLTNFPQKKQWYDQKLIWDTDCNLYIDLTIFTDCNALRSFKQSLQAIHTELAKKIPCSL